MHFGIWCGLRVFARGPQVFYKTYRKYLLHLPKVLSSRGLGYQKLFTSVRIALAGANSARVCSGRLVPKTAKLDAESAACLCLRVSRQVYERLQRSSASAWTVGGNRVVRRATSPVTSCLCAGSRLRQSFIRSSCVGPWRPWRLDRFEGRVLDEPSVRPFASGQPNCGCQRSTY